MSSSAKTGSKGHSSYIAAVLAVSILVFTVSGFAANIGTSSGNTGQGTTVTAGYSTSKVTYGGEWLVNGNGTNTNVNQFAFVLKTAADGVGASTVTNTNTMVWAQLLSSSGVGNWSECVITGYPVAGNTVCTLSGQQQKPMAQVEGVNIVAVDRNDAPLTTPIQDALILYVDASNPASYPGTGNTWFDLSGANNHVTLFNSPTYANNTHFIFNGTNQYARTHNTLNLSAFSAITVEVVFRDRTGSSSQIVFEHSNNWNTNASGFGLAPNSSGSAFANNSNHTNHNGGSGPVDYFGVNGTNIVSHTNIWSRVTDATGRQAYVNGVERDFIRGSKATGNYGAFRNDNMFIGSRNGTVSFGSYDFYSLKVYGRKLSPSEITHNFNLAQSKYSIS